jgi:hypothetical protein
MIRDVFCATDNVLCSIFADIYILYRYVYERLPLSVYLSLELEVLPGSWQTFMFSVLGFRFLWEPLKCMGRGDKRSIMYANMYADLTDVNSMLAGRVIQPCIHQHSM